MAKEIYQDSKTFSTLLVLSRLGVTEETDYSQKEILLQKFLRQAMSETSISFVCIGGNEFNFSYQKRFHNSNGQ